MKQLLTALLAIAVILPLTGCLDEKNEFSVNPDGSGKVVREVFSVEGEGVNLSFGDSSTSKPDTDQQLKELAQDVLQNAKGIETWADIVTEVTDEGKLHFKGTAYFKDITKVSFEQENMSIASGLSIDRSDSGLVTLEMKEDKNEKAPALPANLTTEQIQQQIKQQRLKYNQSKPMMEGILANLKQTTVVHFKGRVKEAVNFQQSDGTIKLALEGKKLMEYMDSVMANDKKMEQMIRAGRTMADSDFEGYYESLGGQRKAPRAVIEPTGILFDYEKEAAKAKADYPAMIKSLKLASAATVETKTIESAPGMDIKDLRVGGVRIIYFEDKTINYRPFHQFVGYQLSLTGKLPVQNLQISKGMLTKAVALGGENLLPEKEFDRSLNFIKIAEDGVSVSFDAKMELPQEEKKGMAEVAGVLKCFKSEAVKKIDLGLMELKEGSANKAEGISITEVGKMDWGDDYKIELKLKILKHVLKDIQLFGEDGQKIETKVSGGTSSGGFWLQRGIRSKDPLPAKGRIVLELYDGLEEYEIPFSLKNIALTGQPLD